MHNRLILLGSVGRDAEYKQTERGNGGVCVFSMATNTSKQDSTGEWKTATTWFQVVTFGKQAERVASTVTKGAKVYAEGRLEADEYEGKTRLKLIADTVKVVSKGGEAGPKVAKKHEYVEVADDDIPF